MKCVYYVYIHTPYGISISQKHNKSALKMIFQVIILTFENVYYLRVLNRRHDLNLPPYPHQVLLSLDLGFLDGLDGNLEEKTAIIRTTHAIHDCYGVFVCFTAKTNFYKKKRVKL